MLNMPRWVEYGAFTLALLAGFVNAVGLLGFQHQSISHLSGMATSLGVDLLHADNMAWHLAMVLLSFILGSTISGFFISSPTLKFGRHYDSMLILEGMCLLFSVYLLQQHEFYGHYFASAACGLQNALATTFSGAIIRTTHLTGIFTDLGLMIGAALRGEAFNVRKCLIFVLIIAGFIGGGTIGALCFEWLEFEALLFPAGLCFLLATGYRFFYRRYQKNMVPPLP